MDLSIIGITGTNSSGKGTANAYLKEKINCETFSLSDIIRDRLKDEGIKIIRKNEIIMGNKLRKKFGKEILSKLTLDKIKQSYSNKINHKIVIIESIRNRKEINYLKENSSSFFLIGIDGEQERRFARNINRNKEYNTKTMREFSRDELCENKNKDSYSQELNECLKLSDTIILNNGSLKEFYKKIDKALKDNIQKLV